MAAERDPGWRGGWLGLVARFPLTRIVLGALSVFGALALTLALVGYVEEILYRGVLLRIVDEGLGTWPALVISAALFGVVHLGTPNATLYTALVISLEAGLLLGAAYVLTRRLWLPIGIHFAWNFMQTGVFGGTRTAEALGARSLLDARLSGPDLLSGGGSGLDGSVFAVTLCLAVAVAFLVLAHRRGRITPPFWRREHAA